MPALNSVDVGSASRALAGLSLLAASVLLSGGVALSGCAPLVPDETASDDAATTDAPSSPAESAETGLAQGADSEARARIEALLDAQVEAWNTGDIESFMDGYWRSGELRFASGGSVQSGWQATLERYRRRYPDRAAMGSLAFEDRDVRLLSTDAALVFGRWRLEREEDAPGGLFTLLLRRVDVGDGERDWRIVHDHTSSEE